jgi:hypothetical protein
MSAAAEVVEAVAVEPLANWWFDAPRELAAAATHEPGRDELFELWEKAYAEPEPDPWDIFPSRGYPRPVRYNDMARMFGASSFTYVHVDRRRRHAIQGAYAWAVTCPEALSALVACGPIVEIGAGTGWWAMRLTESGGDVVAYDNKPYQNYWCARRWHPVRRGGTRMAARHPDRTLLLCWPAGDVGYDAAVAHLEAGGSTVAYIGEQGAGCTGDEQFHELLEERYEPVADADTPQWDGLHDHLVVYRRRGGS